MGGAMDRPRVLIVDDSEMDRSNLIDMLGDGYDVVEAADGAAAVRIMESGREGLSIVLLDIFMPELDGFGVLTRMNGEGWIADLPVVVISTDSDPAHIERAYELGVTDFIGRPFNASIVRRRVVNTILLYAKQRKLAELAAASGNGDTVQVMYGAHGASDRTLALLEHERMKYRFFASLTNEVQFEYGLSPSVLTVFGGGAERLGLPGTVREPESDSRVLAVMGIDDMKALAGALRATSPDDPVVEYEFLQRFGGTERWTRVIARATWSSDGPPRYMGAIGKAMDVHEEKTRMEGLARMASTDALTGLLNRNGAKDKIGRRMSVRPDGKFAVLLMDMDKFKSANDTYGHQFGDEVLKYMADRIRSAIRAGDVAVRVGGDEFLVFLEYKDDLEPVVERIYAKLSGGSCGPFPVSVSLGAASSEDVGSDYDVMFKAADEALYAAKEAGRGRFQLYRDMDPGRKQ